MAPKGICAVFEAPSLDIGQFSVFDGVNVEFSGAIIASELSHAARTGFGDEHIADFELRKIVIMSVRDEIDAVFEANIEQFSPILQTSQRFARRSKHADDVMMEQNDFVTRCDFGAVKERLQIVALSVSQASGGDKPRARLRRIQCNETNIAANLRKGPCAIVAGNAISRIISADKLFESLSFCAFAGIKIVIARDNGASVGGEIPIDGFHDRLKLARERQIGEIARNDQMIGVLIAQRAERIDDGARGMFFCAPGDEIKTAAEPFIEKIGWARAREVEPMEVADVAYFHGNGGISALRSSTKTTIGSCAAASSSGNMA